MSHVWIGHGTGMHGVSHKQEWGLSQMWTVMSHTWLSHVKSVHFIAADTGSVHLDAIGHTCEWDRWPIWLSHVTYERVMSHIWTSPITRMDASCHTYERVTSHIWISHFTRVDESCHTYEWVVSHVWMSRVTRINESCHAYEWVMSHIWMGPIAHMTRSCCTCICAYIYGYMGILHTFGQAFALTVTCLIHTCDTPHSYDSLMLQVNLNVWHDFVHTCDQGVKAEANQPQWLPEPPVSSRQTCVIWGRTRGVKLWTCVWYWGVKFLTWLLYVFGHTHICIYVCVNSYVRADLCIYLEMRLQTVYCVCYIDCVPKQHRRIWMFQDYARCLFVTCCYHCRHTNTYT